MTGRTFWWPKDCAWWRRERIVELGEEFGAAGPAVIDWLSCEAKIQNAGGIVKAGYRTIARGAFVDVDTARHVVSRAEALRLVEDLEQRDGVFTCRLSGLKQDFDRGGAAIRQADKRARDSAESPGNRHDPGSEQDVTDRTVSLPVTDGHGRSDREDKKREEETAPPDPPLASPKGGTRTGSAKRTTRGKGSPRSRGTNPRATTKALVVERVLTGLRAPNLRDHHRYRRLVEQIRAAGVREDMVDLWIEPLQVVAVTADDELLLDNDTPPEGRAFAAERFARPLADTDPSTPARLVTAGERDALAASPLNETAGSVA